MPHLACWSCGQQIYTVSPIESLDAEERRCPRCGASLKSERRDADRRQLVRRDLPSDPEPHVDEHRIEDLRKTRRRKNAADGSNRTGGWTTR